MKETREMRFAYRVVSSYLDKSVERLENSYSKALTVNEKTCLDFEKSIGEHDFLLKYIDTFIDIFERAKKQIESGTNRKDKNENE